MSVKVGFIGTGSMGGALIRGIVKGNADGKYKLFAYDINRDALDQLAETGLTPCRNNIELVCSSDIIFLAIKLSTQGCPGGWERSGKQDPGDHRCRTSHIMV